MTYCFIYLYFFSGSFPRFPFFCTCPRSSRLCCYFHSRCHCNVSYVLSRGKLRNGICYVLSHVCVDVPELFRPRGHCGYSVHTLSFTLSVSLASEVRPLVSTLARCQALPLAVPRMGMTPIVIMLDVLFHIGLWWKGRLLITRKHSNRRPVSLPLCPPTQTNPERQPVFLEAKYLLPAPALSQQKWEHLGHLRVTISALFVPTSQVADFPLFLYCNMLGKLVLPVGTFCLGSPGVAPCPEPHDFAGSSSLRAHAPLIPSKT